MKIIKQRTGFWAGLTLVTTLSLMGQAQEPVNTSDKPVPPPEAARSYVAPAPGEGLKMELGDKGLTSLKYNGEELSIGSNYGGVEMVNHPKFFKTDGTSYPAVHNPTSVTRQDNTVTQVFPWGNITTTYHIKDSRLILDVEVANNAADELQTSLRLFSLKFPITPDSAIMDVGMWGNGGNNKLGRYPMRAALPLFPPVLAIQSPVSRMYFCIDASTSNSGVSVPFPIDGKHTDTAHLFPFWGEVGAIPAGGKSKVVFSLRFAPPTSDPITFAGVRDVLESFTKRYPFTLKWDDRRPIGMIMMASSGVTGENLKLNPSRWIVANGTTQKVNTITPEGRQAFQKLVLRFADESIKVLKEAGAQGMVIWDPEGQRDGHTFYGEPHMIGELAPEMEEEVDVEVLENGKLKTMKMPVIDAFFRKFRDAGLRVGICFRPQKVEFNDAGYPIQKKLSGEDAYQEMKEDLEYARKRWGCTLFYVDSSLGMNGRPLDPEMFMRLNREYPDVLLMPENQTLLYYTCSAPLDSMFHHGVARTAPKIRELWPEAFTVIMAASGTKILGDKNIPPEVHAKRREAMVDGVKHGDILMFNGWYMNKGIKEVMDIYKEAAEAKAAKLQAK